MALSKIKSDSMTDNAIQSNRNFIINGAMKVAQRGTSAVAAGAGTYPSIDRFKAWEDTDGAFTVEQSTTAPAGFTTSLKAQVTTADTSLAAAQYAQLSHQIEAQNLQHLKYGTSSAKTLTLSFHVRSSKTGSYSITLYKDDATKYLFSKSYTIDSANTWEKKIITITPTAGSTSFITSAAGAIANDNGIGFYVFWNLAGGTTYDDATDNAWSSNTNHFHTNSQVNWMDNTSNNFYLTGVQLEIGDVATAFETEDIGTTLSKCQRYFSKSDFQSVVPAQGSDNKSVTTSIDMAAGLLRTTAIPFPFYMRTAPTVTPLKEGAAGGGSNGQWAYYQAGTWTYNSFSAGTISEQMYTGHTTGGAGDGQAYYTHINWTADAEL